MKNQEPEFKDDGATSDYAGINPLLIPLIAKKILEYSDERERTSKMSQVCILWHRLLAEIPLKNSYTIKFHPQEVADLNTNFDPFTKPTVRFALKQAHRLKDLKLQCLYLCEQNKKGICKFIDTLTEKGPPLAALHTKIRIKSRAEVESAGEDVVNALCRLLDAESTRSNLELFFIYCGGKEKPLKLSQVEKMIRTLGEKEERFWCLSIQGGYYRKDNSLESLAEVITSLKNLSMLTLSYSLITPEMLRVIMRDGPSTLEHFNIKYNGRSSGRHHKLIDNWTELKQLRPNLKANIIIHNLYNLDTFKWVLQPDAPVCFVHISWNLAEDEDPEDREYFDLISLVRFIAEHFCDQLIEFHLSPMVDEDYQYWEEIGEEIYDLLTRSPNLKVLEVKGLVSEENISKCNTWHSRNGASLTKIELSSDGLHDDDEGDDDGHYDYYGLGRRRWLWW